MDSDPEIEARKEVFLVTGSDVLAHLIQRFSSLTKLLRTSSYVIRFISNCTLSLEKRNMGPLSTEEIQASYKRLLIYVQNEDFHMDIKCLQSSKPIPFSSRLLSLNPFLDSDGLLRVGGRLTHSELSYDQKHPIIISGSNRLTQLIINHHHREQLHAGFQLLHTIISVKFWIVRARNAIRSVLRNCLRCRRLKGKTMEQLMGELPLNRVLPHRPFLHNGIDYAGPFTLQTIRGRGKTQFKSYFAVFVCFSSKAVHLEPVTDLTTASFIGTLKRFVSRRGLCSHLYSDNGTNFKGADAELKSFLDSAQFQDTVAAFTSSKGIIWRFNPPSAPHQGGLWEAAVKSTKYHLRRVMGTSALTLEEFFTILAQIEACLNSRPLCSISSSPSDLSILTPGHFLIGEPLSTIPEPSLLDLSSSYLSRWQLVQQRFQNFWKQWSNEYLSTLQKRYKWTRRSANCQMGDLVLLKDDNHPPLFWKLGRILTLHPGSDGLTRVVTVKTATGEFLRSITKLCPLLTQEELSG